MSNIVPLGRSPATRAALYTALDTCDSLYLRIDEMTQLLKTKEALIESNIDDRDKMREVLKDPDQLTEALNRVAPERLMKTWRL